MDKSTILIGINENIEKVYIDMKTAPHLLIGGSTGCGKSVLLSQIFDSIKSGVILIDPKMVEFTPLTNCEKVFENKLYSTETEINYILSRLTRTMHDRYNYLTIHGYKGIYDTENIFEPIFILFDEYADLNVTQRKIMINLLRLGRAAGIHFIIATQRPSRKIIDGDIKANITHRIAMKTATATDSRIIIDGFSGAVNLPQAQGYFYYSNGEKIQYLRSLLD